jgi:endonuclease YncB( thermonuclease family)
MSSLRRSGGIVGHWRRRLRGLLQGPLGPLLLSTLVLLLVVLPQRQEAARSAPPLAGAHLACTLDNIIDGDTIDVHCDGNVHRVRIWGIDAPERAQKPWGDIATRRLAELLRGGPVEVHVDGLDVYGRVLARVAVGELRDAGLKLVREGFVSVRTRYVTDGDYRAARTEASRERRGIWSQPGAQQRPWEWRRLNPPQDRNLGSR